MKYADIRKMREADLISAEQELRIARHFNLKEQDNRFLAIISGVGALLVAAGIVLLIAANWDEIPRGIKISAGLALMLGAHAGGWYLREIRGAHVKIGEALHLVGSCLFLANIGLIGQIYHLSSRPPNALLLWWLGIAPLPWILRSKAQFLLCLSAFGIWFGMEINEPGSWIFFGKDQYQVLLYSLLGLIVLGGGYRLRRTAYAEFARSGEKLGLLAFQLFFLPLTWGILYRQHSDAASLSPWILPLMAGLALVLPGLGAARLAGLSRSLQWSWTAALAGGVALIACAHYLNPQTTWTANPSHWLRWLCTAGLFLFCLVEIQVGLRRRNEFMVNLGIGFIALTMISTYLNLFGSMARTGLMFVVSGLVLMAFGVFIEKKRRDLVRQLKSPAVSSPPDPTLQTQADL
jgi:uncharacterized membrane protein